MYLNPQMDADMTRIGCRVASDKKCMMCQGCYNRKACIHLERWHRVQRGLTGGKRECGPGWQDLGLICSKRTCHGDPWKTVFESGHEECSIETYGKYDDEFTAAFDQIGNFFKNLPASVKAAFAPDGPLAHVFDPNLNGVGAALRKAGGELLDAFDPEKNGVAAAFRKFKQDTEAAFEEIGRKLRDTFSADKINAAFAPFVAMLNKFGESVSNYFSDPSNIVAFICILMTTAASALPPPLSNALSVLAACTKMIGDAALGKPFDPMDLLDLGQAFVLPPQAKLAGTIAKTTSKATTVLGKVAAGANAVGKAAISEAKTVARNVAKMSAKDKALLLGKSIVKVSGKVAGGPNGPVDSQQTAAQNRSDEEIGEIVFELDDDPAAVERGEEFMANQNREDQEEAYRRYEETGTETGEVREQMRAAIDEAAPYFLEQETEPSLDEMVQTATQKPKAYSDPEKDYFYGEKANEEFANESKTSAASLEGLRQRRAAAEAKRTGQTQAAVAKAMEIKEKNEKRKYGLTLSEAEANLNVAQSEIQQFKSAYTSTGNSSLLGGGDELPPFQEQDVEYSGEDLPGNTLNLKIFKTIRTPTFKSFLKNKLVDPPQILKSDDWYPAYKKFMDWYSKSKTDYNALLAANATAIATYKAKPRAEVEEAMDAVLNQQRDPNNPPAPTPAAVPLTPQQEFNVKLADFYNGNKFLYATGEFPNLSLEAYNQQMANSGNAYAITPGFDLETMTQKPGYDNPDGTWHNSDEDQPPPPVEDATSFYGDEPTGGKKKRNIRDFFGGSLLVAPPKADILKYYTSVFVRANPDNPKPDELAMLKQYERDWNTDAAGTLALMNAFKAQSGGRKRKGRKGGDAVAEEDPEPEPVVAELDEEKEARVQEILANTERRGYIQDAVRRNALEKIGKDTFTIDLPDALEQYLAATPKDKRVKRAKIHTLMAFTDAKFGTLSEIQAHTDQEITSKTWYQPALDWIASLEEKAPELLNKGTDATPEAVYKSSPTALQNEETRKKMLVDIKQTTEEATATENQGELSDKQYQDALKEYEAATDKAGSDEAARDAALAAFNAKFAADDPRRLQGSGKPGPTLLMRNLYLGNRDDAANKKFLRKARIRTVFNCTRNVPETKSAGVTTVRFALDDSPEDVSVMKEKGAEWASQVMEAMVDGPVLIHCVEGRQRSPAIAAMVLALHKPKRGGNAMKAVRAKRPFAFTPKANFEEAIKRWLG